MYLFFVEPQQIGETSAFICGADVNHIKNVLRMRIGERIRISNGQDACYNCTITGISDERVEVSLDEFDPVGTELPAKIYLYQALPKGDKMEFIIQKNVELGIAGIVPVATGRAVVKLDAKKADAKVKRWQAIAESAAKQSKRTVVPDIYHVMSFKEAVDHAAKNCGLLLFPYENAEGIKAAKGLIDSIRPGMNVAVFIGPEGGFESSEVEYALQSGFKTLTLGRRILRTETAGMMLMSVIMFNLESGEF
ncbi:MAG: 16S rRNA (uracil(1498)-N(3))-methyltransferase [Lachnospiraceae bacterium]|nr:16S rRNA (uracil(1498)-N(3))-methyltransferase [Lachnospiraceae bacterium]